MTNPATVTYISGLHGEPLAAFHRAIAKIDANMKREQTAEKLMRDVRIYLGMAHEYECGRKLELADACGAIAANKLARSIRLSAT